jgi:hypothetical protein
MRCSGPASHSGIADRSSYHPRAPQGDLPWKPYAPYLPPAVAARAARPRHASHLNRSLLALIFAPRMTETEAAEYAQGRSSAAVAAIGAWALAVMAALALAAVISAHVFAVRAELYGMDYSRALDVHRFWVEWSTVAWDAC